MKRLEDLRIKIFADGADLAAIRALSAHPLIKGFTTNPTLMRAAGVADYARFAHDVLQIVRDRPVSFEVFADDPAEMEAQAMTIASWGANVNVKIPVTTTDGTSCAPLVRRLSERRVKVNVTAVLTLEQVSAITDALSPSTPAIISIFAGRIADTGVDPIPLVRSAAQIAKKRPLAELIWASPRELLNIFHAEQAGAHIITVTPDILKKAAFVGKDLAEFSLETVRMFHRDAASAGYTITTQKDRNAAAI